MASVVGTYARAFADVIMSTKADSARLLAELHSMEALLAESADLRRVLENPSIPAAQRNAVIDAVTR
ncbi:MAG: F0F1 ATP synthase subunit delta, partial [Terriglobales bacterium]